MPKNKRKARIRGECRVSAYRVLSRAVEEGVALGWNRAHKHTDRPSEEDVRSKIEDAVMIEISQYFDFDYEIDKPDAS